MKNKASVIVAAAGNSSRMGDNKNKQFMIFGGKPVLAHTLSVFDKSDNIDEIIVVTKEDSIDSVNDLAVEYNIKKLKTVVPGGATRQESVFIGLSHVASDKVLIHDGARPFITETDISGIVSALDLSRAVAIGVTPKDTIKRINDDNIIEETLPREKLVQIQTPQAFHTEDIIKAHKTAIQNNLEVTDDCALAEYIGIPVKVIIGSYKNIKITTPEDLSLAESLFEEEL